MKCSVQLVSAQTKAPLLIPGTNLRLADVLVRPPAPPPGTPLGKPTACDITVCSPYMPHTIRHAASSAVDATALAGVEKLHAFERTARAGLSLTDTVAMPDLRSAI